MECLFQIIPLFKTFKNSCLIKVALNNCFKSNNFNINEGKIYHFKLMQPKIYHFITAYNIFTHLIRSTFFLHKKYRLKCMIFVNDFDHPDGSLPFRIVQLWLIDIITHNHIKLTLSWFNKKQESISNIKSIQVKIYVCLFFIFR